MNINRDVLDWHATKVRKISREKMLSLLYDNTPTQETAWNSFKDYLQKYHCGTGKKSIFTAPIRGGHNICGYDNIIWQRLCERYKMVGADGEQNLTMGNRNQDTMNLLWPWFENDPDVNSMSMDNLRKYFGMKVEGGHDALNDVRDSAAIIIRFLQFHRAHAQRTKFKGSFANAVA